MDAGRRWALETFGTYGPALRTRISELVKREHESSLDAQEASGHRSQGVYGQFWRGILEKFEEFDDFPGATMMRPGNAPYKVPVLNGVAVFPWRFAKTKKAELKDTRFGISDARVATTRLHQPAIQESLDLDLPDADLSLEERELITQLQSVRQASEVSSGRLVLVAISSSARGLFTVDWGEVDLDPAGFVHWKGPHESLLSLRPSGPVSASPTRTFVSGPVPNKFKRATRDEEASSSTDE